MKISNAQKNYIPLLIPIDKPFIKLTPEEAKEYFDWFIMHVDERSEYLKQKVAENLRLDTNKIDFSLDSLIYIWRWFLSVAELNKTPKVILDKIKDLLNKNGKPKEFIEDMLQENKMELSVFSHYVIRDIGMYVGKMFVTNFQSLRWDYHTDIEKDSFANMPQIFGFIDNTYTPPFEEQFEPIHYTEMQASNLFDNTANEKDLYNMCIQWTRRIP